MRGAPTYIIYYQYVSYIHNFALFSLEAFDKRIFLDITCQFSQAGDESVLLKKFCSTTLRSERSQTEETDDSGIENVSYSRH